MNINNLSNMSEVVNYLSLVKKDDVDLDKVNKVVVSILKSGKESDIEVFAHNITYLSKRIVSKVVKQIDAKIIMKIHSFVNKHIKKFLDPSSSNKLLHTFLDISKNPDSFIAGDLVDSISESFNKSTLEYYVKNKKMAYHVSSLTIDKLKDDNNNFVNTFTIRPSFSGAMEPGVYTSPYPNLMYTGGDIEKKELNNCVIFGYSPDSNHLLYGVSQDYYLDNIEISSRTNKAIKLEGVEVTKISKNELEQIGAKYIEKASKIDYYLVTSKRYTSEPYVR